MFYVFQEVVATWPREEKEEDPFADSLLGPFQNAQGEAGGNQANHFHCGLPLNACFTCVFILFI